MSLTPRAVEAKAVGAARVGAAATAEVALAETEPGLEPELAAPAQELAVPAQDLAVSTQEPARGRVARAQVRAVPAAALPPRAAATPRAAPVHSRPVRRAAATAEARAAAQTMTEMAVSSDAWRAGSVSRLCSQVHRPRCRHRCLRSQPSRPTGRRFSRPASRGVRRARMVLGFLARLRRDRKSPRLNSSHSQISYA